MQTVQEAFAMEAGGARIRSAHTRILIVFLILRRRSPYLELLVSLGGHTLLFGLTATNLTQSVDLLEAGSGILQKHRHLVGVRYEYVNRTGLTLPMPPAIVT